MKYLTTVIRNKSLSKAAICKNTHNKMSARQRCLPGPQGRAWPVDRHPVTKQLGQEGGNTNSLPDVPFLVIQASLLVPAKLELLLLK